MCEAVKYLDAAEPSGSCGHTRRAARPASCRLATKFAWSGASFKNGESIRQVVPIVLRGFGRAYRGGAVLLVLVLWGVFVRASSAAAQDRVRFADSSVLTVNVSSGGAGNATVVVLNDGPMAAPILSIVSTEDMTSGILVTRAPTQLNGFGATTVSLTFTGVPTSGVVTGDLIVSVPDVGSASRPILLTTTIKSPNQAWLWFAPLCAAVIFVLIRLRFLWTREMNRFNMATRLGPAGWDFSKSWASNLTAAGALLGVVVAGSILPDPPHLLTKSQYGALNVYFGLLVAAAAFFYNAIVVRKEIKPLPPTDPSKPPDPVTYQSVGLVWTYLVASLLTLWAVWGELGTLYVMLTDILGNGRFDSLSSIVIAAASLLLAISGGIYAWRTIGWNIWYFKEQPPPPPPADASEEERIAIQEAQAAKALPRFSLL